MSEHEESLAAELAPSGSLAWQRLHGDVSSQLHRRLRRRRRRVERVPMAFARGLATHPDADRRRAAYEGELAAWATVAVPLAAALNGAKGELGVLNRRRGFADDLEPALRANNVDRATLDAMTEAVVASLPDFRRYLRAKARLLGHDGALPWWDLFAPVGTADDVVVGRRDRSRARPRSRASRPISSGSRTARSPSSWVDAEIRDGKQRRRVLRRRRRRREPRDDELRRQPRLGVDARARARPRVPQRRAREPRRRCSAACRWRWPRPRRSSARRCSSSRPPPKQPTTVERLALLDAHLVGATQVVVDIHSRFLFETELCARRRRTSLSVADLQHRDGSTRRKPRTATGCTPSTATSTCGR